jgi:amino acid permease
MAWKISTAIFALLMAVAVYLFARLNPPALLEPFQITNSLLGAQSDFFGSAPSLFYTLSIGLLIGVFASTSANGRLHCLVWIGLALCLEISQASIIAEPLTSWLSTTLPHSAWELFGPYWANGVFDPFDLLATIVGGMIALTVLTYLPREEIKDDIDR